MILYRHRKKIHLRLCLKKELRGVWVTTAWGIDWPMEEYNATAQKQKYIDYLDLLVENKMNAIFFQIRGMADAFL